MRRDQAQQAEHLLLEAGYPLISRMKPGGRHSRRGGLWLLGI